MGYILDLIFIAIVALCIFLAVKKGFVRSLVEVVGYLLAVVIAFSVSSFVADYVYNQVIETKLVETISTAVEQNSNDVIDKMPDYLVAILDKTNVDLDKLLSSDNLDSQKIANQVSEVIEPLAVNIVRTIASIIIFIILIIVVSILARFLNSLFKGVILGTANKVLGGALGFVKGFVIASLFSLAVYFIANTSTSEILFFTNDAIEGSFICNRVISFITGIF